MRRRPVHEGNGNPHRFRPFKPERESRRKKTVKRFGKDITVVNDNGSEYMKDAEDFLRENHITRYWTGPKSPKEKPFVERLIGTFPKECPDYHHEPMDVKEPAGLTDSGLDKYHFYRSRESLKFLTPAEYCSTLGLPIPHAAAIHGEMSYM